MSATGGFAESAAARLGRQLAVMPAETHPNFDGSRSVAASLRPFLLRTLKEAIGIALIDHETDY